MTLVGGMNRFRKKYKRRIYELHGQSKSSGRTSLYKRWLSIKSRCYLPGSISYKYYGARGITVCDVWRNSFIAFSKWAHDNGYDERLQIDRIDSNGNYEPANCRFVSAKENNKNRRNVKMDDESVRMLRYLRDRGFNGLQLAKIFNITNGTVYKIINYHIWIE